MAGATGAISSWAGGGATTTLGAAQLAYGLYQQKHNKRPTYEIPEEVKQNLTQAQQQALQGLPEEQKQQFLDNIQRSTAYGLGQQSSRQGGLAGIAQINQNQNQAYGNLLSADSQARRENQGALMGQRQNMADYRDQAFQFNKVNPYYEQTAQNNAMIGAGIQNVSQGFQAGNQGGGAEYGNSVKQPQGNGATTGQMSQQFWNGQNNQGILNNYNPNSQNGSGNFNYQGNQYDNVG